MRWLDLNIWCHRYIRKAVQFRSLSQKRWSAIECKQVDFYIQKNKKKEYEESNWPRLVKPV